MNAFDYMRKELDRIELGCLSREGTKPTFTIEDVRKLIDNVEKSYNKELEEIIEKWNAVNVFHNWPA